MYLQINVHFIYSTNNIVQYCTNKKFEKMYINLVLVYRLKFIKIN